MPESKQQLALPTESTALARNGTSTTAYPPLVLAEPGSGLPPALADGPTLSGLLQALRRRWLLAVSLALLGAISAVLIIVSLWPAPYTAVARLQLASRSDAPIFGNVEHDEDFLTFKTNIAALLKSPLILNAALRSDEAKKLSLIRDQGVDWLEHALKTDFKGPGILEVKLSADRPGEVAELLNLMVDSFLKELRARDTERRNQKTRELETNFAARKTRLDSKRNQLRRLESANNLDDLETAKEKFKAILAQVRDAQKDLSDCGKDQARLKQEIKTAEEELKGIDRRPISEKQVDDALRAGPLSQQLYTNLAQIEKGILDVKTNAQGPLRVDALASLTARKEATQSGLQALREQLKPELERKIRAELIDEIHFRLQQAQRQFANREKEESYLLAKTKAIDVEANKVNPSRRPNDMIALADEIREEENILQQLGGKIETYKMEPVPGSRVSVLQEAQEPHGRDLSRHTKIAGAAGFGIFGILLFGVAFFEFRTRRISAAAEVAHGLGMSLVATLPAVPPRARKKTGAKAADLQLQQQLTEAVDGMRTMLLHAARSEKLSTIMITSAFGGEGKTSLATQLAASLARAWRKTLLIDGDIRNPDAHKIFDVPQEPGFCELLRAEVSEADAIRPTALSRLWIMPAGQWDSHAIQALAQDNVHDLFTQLKQQYDFIIVDSCPVLSVADSLLLAQHVDGVLLSVLRDVSRTPAVYAAHQRLQNLGIRTLGAVVIGDSAAATAYPARST